MKKLIVLAVLFLLNGCAMVDYYRMAKWDNNEYMLVNEIHTDAQFAMDKCVSKQDVLPHVDYEYRKSIELANYSSGIARNEETIKMTSELLAIVKGLRERYYSGDEVSQKFCELKFTSIITNTGTIQKSLGAKPR